MSTTETKLPTTRAEFRAFLREHGFSKRQAEKIASEGFRPEPNAEDDPIETETAEDEAAAAELLGLLKRVL